MAPRSTKRTLQPDECTPVQCLSSFDALDISINKLGLLVEKIDDRMDAMGERIAAQEAHAKDTSRKVDGISASFHRLSDLVRREVQDHSTSCPGREYALRKIKSASITPPSSAAIKQQDSTGSFMLDDEFKKLAVRALDERGKGFSIPKWVINVGVIVGVAIAAGAYALGKLLGS